MCKWPVEQRPLQQTQVGNERFKVGHWTNSMISHAQLKMLSPCSGTAVGNTEKKKNINDGKASSTHDRKYVQDASCEGILKNNTEGGEVQRGKAADDVSASVTAQPVNVPSNTDDKTLSDDGHLPDASTKDAPPALPGAGAASPLSQCHPTVDTVVLPRLPKPPNICSLHAGPVDLQDLAGMVQRRRNALRRISKKEKV
ncbi:hypothetical protein C8J57DRAFT_1254999 [Mycena rebaudengoi]|nr:hypothetical protein C8J57DRAFT_1254999 [Mycena rebaudengoi]